MAMTASSASLALSRDANTVLVNILSLMILIAKLIRKFSTSVYILNTTGEA